MHGQHKFVFLFLAAAFVFLAQSAIESSRSRDSDFLAFLSGHNWWKSESDAQFIENLKALQFDMPLGEAAQKHHFAIDSAGPVFRAQDRKADFTFDRTGRLEAVRAIHVLDKGADPASVLKRADEAVRALDAGIEIRDIPQRPAACEKDAERFPRLCDRAAQLHLYAGPKLEGRAATARPLEDDSVIELALELRVKQ